MTGDYTKVPLRPDDRWTGARMQQGRVLLDHEWNLNLDAAARAARGGGCGRDRARRRGRRERRRSRSASRRAGTLDLDVARRADLGRRPDGATRRPTSPTRSRIRSSRASGDAARVLVYLDVFEEHVQPAEDADDLVDPALAPVDSAARTRVGYRVRVRADDRDTCEDALGRPRPRRRARPGTLSIARVGARGAGRSRARRPATRSASCPTGSSASRSLDRRHAATRASPGRSRTARAAVAVAPTVAGDQVTLRPVGVRQVRDRRPRRGLLAGAARGPRSPTARSTRSPSRPRPARAATSSRSTAP